MIPGRLRVLALVMAVALVAATLAPLGPARAFQVDDDLRLDGVVLDLTLRPALRLKGVDGWALQWAPSLPAPRSSAALARVSSTPPPPVRQATPIVLRI